MGEAAGQLFGMLPAVPFIGSPSPFLCFPPSSLLVRLPLDELLFKRLERFPFLPCFILSRYVSQGVCNPSYPSHFNTDATWQENRNSQTYKTSCFLTKKYRPWLWSLLVKGLERMVCSLSFHCLTCSFLIVIISKFAISNKLHGINRDPKSPTRIFCFKLGKMNNEMLNMAHIVDTYWAIFLDVTHLVLTLWEGIVVVLTPQERRGMGTLFHKTWDVDSTRAI